MNLISHLILQEVFVSAFEEGFCSGKNINHGVPHVKFCAYFSLLKGDADGDKPLELHAASNEKQTQK